MSYSFIGPYFLDPYLAAYEEALNLAAEAFNDPANDHDRPKLLDRPRPSSPTYTLVRSKNVGMTAVLLFARDATAIVDVKEAEVGFGAAEMGNKGAAGLRVVYEDAESGRSTELTFVGTHLAAMEWNLAKRNANWATIMRGLTFGNPEEILKPRPATSEASLQGNGESGARGASVDEVMRLLHDQHDEENRQMQQRLQDISVFKPTSHLFVAGDLNYRISATAPTPNASFPSLDPQSENYYPRFFPLDQLTRERKSGRTLHGLSEADVEFPPTYKYDIVPGSDNPLEVSWKFAPHRYPSWTDRVLYLDVPPWTKEQNPDVPDIKVQAYDAMPVLASSDHRPVFLRADVPIIAKEDLFSPRQQGDSTYPAEWDLDPRAKLPVEIDPEAWERRAAARQREVMAGWSMFFFSTQEGTLVLGTLVVAAISGWWLYRQW